MRLRTDTGLVGLGEASDAFGFANTTADDAARMQSQLAVFFNLINGRSPFEIESYRQRGEAMAPGTRSGHRVQRDRTGSLGSIAVVDWN